MSRTTDGAIPSQYTDRELADALGELNAGRGNAVLAEARRRLADRDTPSIAERVQRVAGSPEVAVEGGAALALMNVRHPGDHAPRWEPQDGMEYGVDVHDSRDWTGPIYDRATSGDQRPYHVEYSPVFRCCRRCGWIEVRLYYGADGYWRGIGYGERAP